MILFLVIIVLSAVLYTNVARDYVNDEEVSEEILIILTSFTVMSLLTGVISDNVIETASEEEEEIKRKAARDRMLFAEALRNLYDKANTRDNFNGVTRSAL